MKAVYLKGYNLLLLIGWSVFLMLQLSNGMQMEYVSLLLLNVCQTSAILEILHASLRWVRSPVSTTAIQVSSRILVLVWINIIPLEEEIIILGVSGVQLVTLAWGITEVIRYGYYFFGQLDIQLKALTFLRYTLFIALYPIGVAGEWLILFSQIKRTGWELSLVNIALIAIMLAYLYYFPKLYFYMFRQRKSRIG